MPKRFFPYFQYCMPQHLLSIWAGKLANSTKPWLKKRLIAYFMKKYAIDLSIAKLTNAEDYPSFNSFFIRELQTGSRPIAALPEQIACPADGAIAELGNISNYQLLQAKEVYYSLHSLLGNDQKLSSLFNEGSFATIYLAPHNYHRVHMPLTGQLKSVKYIPGKLFSVNRLTSALIPNLYGRNERLITVFETAAGPMAIILVGAMIVGSIKTIWMDKPLRQKTIYDENIQENIMLEKGSELGHFELGSTVIVLFGQNKIEWNPDLHSQTLVQVGQAMGQILP